MTKRFILSEIRRTAEENGGSPLGKQRFLGVTGIKESDWYGKFWARWSDAIKEAGFTPNVLQQAYDENWLIERLIDLIRELEHFPTSGDLRIKARNDEEFPSHNTFRRFGRKAEVAVRVMNYCNQFEVYDDVIQICSPLAAKAPSYEVKGEGGSEEDYGYVYLLKSGRYYKIGRSSSVGRRERELAIQLPDKAEIVHSIRTDDPVGIEGYWHKRFADKRKNGEWFELNSGDVKTFRRRSFM